MKVKTFIALLGFVTTLTVLGAVDPLFFSSKALLTQSAHAQAKKTPVSLFSTKALGSANLAQQQRSDTISRYNWELGSLGFFTSAADSFRFDQIDDVGVVRERRNGTYTMFKTLRQNYDSAARGAWDAYDESGEIESLTKRVAVYQGLNDAGAYLISSSIGPILMDTVRTLGDFREMITFKVAHRDDGSLRFRNGKTKNRFLELSVATSARRGIEPRIRLFDNVMIKYDIFDEATIIEYNRNF